MADYTFELLTEEIPAWMLDGVTSALHERLSLLASGLRSGQPDTEPMSAASVVVNATSRRIGFVLKGLPEREADREQDVKGPPKKNAFATDGTPTQALTGFLRKQNASLEDILPGDDPYVLVRRKTTGRATSEILTEQIPALIESLRWPKMMRWGTGEHSYIRPIHSMVSLFDGEHLPVTLFGTSSGTSTTGHRTLAPKRFEVSSWNDYVSKLELARVVTDAARRREVMAHRARLLAQEVGGTPSVDGSIWSQWQYLTEYPGLVRAEFRREYLALPEEVLVTVMRVHQKQLPIRDEAGKLTNHFLAVMDNESDPEGNASYGNSFVTNARFADAQFFYETDRRRKLEERVEQLSHLQFQEKLGDYRAKTVRIEKIAQGICAAANLDASDVITAARLCKSDLVTEMVKEFTDLQGAIGGIYAREEGHSESVWQAIYDQYQPISLEDALPRTASGAVLSLADRIDTLVGFFSIGARPTGSKDPFGLRRAAQGVVQILLNRDKREIRIGIEPLVDLAIAAYGEKVAQNPKMKEDLLAFFAERVRTILEASAWKFAYDEIAAAMESVWGRSLTDLVDRIHALRDVRNEPDFLSILDSAKRIANITAGHDAGRVDPALLEHESERRLAERTESVTTSIEELVAQREYRQALERFATLAPELESFFKDVMVMVDDAALKANRMSLLRRVGGAATRIADVTKIVVDRREYR